MYRKWLYYYSAGVFATGSSSGEVPKNSYFKPSFLANYVKFFLFASSASFFKMPTLPHTLPKYSVGLSLLTLLTLRRNFIFSYLLLYVWLYVFYARTTLFWFSKVEDTICSVWAQSLFCSTRPTTNPTASPTLPADGALVNTYSDSACSSPISSVATPIGGCAAVGAVSAPFQFGKHRITIVRSFLKLNIHFYQLRIFLLILIKSCNILKFRPSYVPFQ